MGLRGPKKGSKYKCTQEAAMFRDYLRKKMLEAKAEIVESMIQKAKGCPIIDKKDETGERIFDLPPDSRAFDSICDQAFGKVPQPIEGSGEDGEFLHKVIATQEQISRFAKRHVK